MSFAGAIAAPPATLRVGLLTRDVISGMAVDSECSTAVARCGALLESLGHHVEEAHPPALDGMIVRLWPGLSGVLAATRPGLFRSVERMAGRPLTQDDLQEPLLRDTDVAHISGVQVVDALGAIAREARAVRSWWDDGGYDLLATPVLRRPPWPLGGKGGADDAGIFPFPFSLTWQPAMSLPLHWTEAGLPVGVQIVAAYGRDDVALRVAAQLEEAAPWANRWPPLVNATD